MITRFSEEKFPIAEYYNTFPLLPNTCTDVLDKVRDSTSILLHHVCMLLLCNPFDNLELLERLNSSGTPVLLSREAH